MAVGAGDKEPSFAGSSQWIGALELSFVLDTLLGVTCRVLDVAAGSDLPSKARELAHHFNTQGECSWLSVHDLRCSSRLLSQQALSGRCSLAPGYANGKSLVVAA